ncbi:heavy-metal-associated domain-containing protein [Salinirussus salinus]|jgi:copper chaperone CopZ|uniref:heavy-metal-associated domain-containing protein n=1 Tax=Salinirussus salinus TaxID=1198300 RepID=UPI001359A462|nr:cation transporter [Salinirussus salinus]
MTTITVEGMSCEHCEQTVEEAVCELSGVNGATADRESQQVEIDGDADIGDVVRVVEDAGYTASA